MGRKHKKRVGRPTRRKYVLTPEQQASLERAEQAQAAGHLAIAEKAYRRLLAEKAKNPRLYYQLALLCAHTARHEEAQKLFSRALAAKPGFRDAGMGLASSYRHTGDIGKAMNVYQKIVTRYPAYVPAKYLLANLFKARGEFGKAAALYKQVMTLQPDYTQAHFTYSGIHKYQDKSDSHLHQMLDLSQRDGLQNEQKIQLAFALGKAFEDRNEYESSFDYYERGNRLKMARSGYDPDNTSELIQQQIDTCTAELFETRGHLGCQRPDPIFIVGMPRAGSTLLEQILASHSMVDGTMELHEILGLAQRLRGRSTTDSPAYPRNLWDLDDSYFERFGDKFISDTRAYRGDAPHFIDKMPNNFMHIGLIRLILPNARIIDARRHPMACGFSCFKQLFGEGQDFSYGLEAIGRYYSDYARLMDHWDKVLPGFILRVPHEDVVDDLEGQVRRLLDFCGLPFEESCLDFHRTKRAVKTPSSEQVRQPIYRSGLDYWQNYTQWLGPLQNSLDKPVRHLFGIE